MKNDILDIFPFGVLELNSHGQIMRQNSLSKETLPHLNRSLLKLLAAKTDLVEIPFWPGPVKKILYLRNFRVAGNENALILIGEEPNFWTKMPTYLELGIENFTADPHVVAEKIAELVGQTLTYERFDLIRVTSHSRKFTYEYSIGINIHGTLPTAFSAITNSGLGWILQNALPHLVESLTPDLFSFREDPMLYQTGFRSVLRVPILFEHDVVGAFMLASLDPGRFKIEHAFIIDQLAKLVAQQFFHAGIQLQHKYEGIANAALLRTIISNLNTENIDEFLSEYCERLRQSSLVDRVSIFALDPDQEKRLLIVGAGIEPAPKQMASWKEWTPIVNTGVEKMLLSKSLLILDLADPVFQNLDNDIRRDFTKILYAPIENDKGETIGFITGMSSDEKTLSSSTAGLFKVASDHLGLILSKVPKQQLGKKSNPSEQLNQYPVPKGFENIIGTSKAIRETIHKASLAAKYDFPILITGETGTGKELFARAIHQTSPVAQGPFIAVNSAAIPANLLESELFGYQEGAFTGGIKGGKRGKILLANGGTLFLDEIGELSPDLQAKLLRVVQEKEIEPLGANKPIPVNIRVISATNQDLTKAIALGQFREDLFYRLNTIELQLPPLRERNGDILLLAEQLLRFLSESHGVPLKSLSACAKEILMRYSWPGNVRQLQNVINRIFVFVEGQQIEAKDLPPDIGTITDLTHETEQARMARLLKEFNGNKTALAHYLGITRTGLWKKLKRLGLQNSAD